MMVHPTDTPVAYTTMMAHGRLKCLTLPAHAVTRALPPLLLLRHGRAGHRSRIRQRRLRMARQRHGAQQGVNHAKDGGYPLRDRKKGHGHGRVRHEEPDEGGHDGPGLISGIHPYSLLFAGAEGEGPRIIVVGVNVIFAGGAYAGRGLLDRTVVVIVVFEIFRRVYLTAAGGVEAGAQEGAAGRGGRAYFSFGVGVMGLPIGGCCGDGHGDRKLIAEVLILHLLHRDF
mmetsp:Transcript_22173/g.46786  ORF Transcript_22173/g.46786 Transcript_22173/m.46786 type:complete len:228 (-) Transcript_22173:188-871(-)